MKFQKLPLLPLALMVLSLYSCTSEDSPTSGEITDPAVINPAEQKLVSIAYPSSNNLAYMMDKQEFKYDNSKRINVIGSYLSVSYVGDDLIETKTLGDNVSNADIENKTSIVLKNKNVTSIISNTVFKRTTGETYSIERDSTVYSYANEYISKILSYHKKSVDGDGKYRLQRQLDFQVTAGNITQVKTAEYGEVVVSNYTYDSTPNILMGDIAYETPLSLIRGYNILLHDKLGKRNVNNVVSMENVFKETPFQKSYKTVNYRRNVDKYGRISEIVISGSCVTSNPFNTATNFTDEKVIFEYK
ncbi:hypothetical protein [Flavobacterium sp. UGB4466]|uniref:hypothetical protein n=1 Tax=Flavobacterium sp. UGB4466 TaxID=2730889 RepID=UPI00192A885C|nr:hypothetical protein [Flavobacterium sp. UGB4466]